MCFFPKQGGCIGYTFLSTTNGPLEILPNMKGERLVVHVIMKLQQRDLRQQDRQLSVRFAEIPANQKTPVGVGFEPAILVSGKISRMGQNP